jgi:hypothetical protein
MIALKLLIDVGPPRGPGRYFMYRLNALSKVLSITAFSGYSH